MFDFSKIVTLLNSIMNHMEIQNKAKKTETISLIAAKLICSPNHNFQSDSTAIAIAKRIYDQTEKLL